MIIDQKVELFYKTNKSEYLENRLVDKFRTRDEMIAFIVSE
jgi:hypothetical protein